MALIVHRVRFRSCLESGEADKRTAWSAPERAARTRISSLYGWNDRFASQPAASTLLVALLTYATPAIRTAGDAAAELPKWLSFVCLGK